MDFEQIQNLAYIGASILFILGIKMLGKADTARKGNRLSAIGMTIAVLATVIGQVVSGQMHWAMVLAGLVLGGGIGLFSAKKVEMTGMPELVALFNGLGGLGSLLVGWAEVAGVIDIDGFTGVTVWLTVLIGGVTFTGSMVAWAKLAEKISGSAVTFSGQKLVNIVLFLALLVCGGMWISSGAPTLLYAVIALSLVLGVLVVIPIGGGDMPVVIALLNSFSGLAAAAAGFVITNNVLIVAGCLVGTSGLILTVIMCKAMNRTLSNVLFGSFGAASGSGAVVEGEMKALSVEDAFYVLEAARNVVFVPGYGMAVAQAQHVVKELGELLAENGAEVRFAIHPVAGRMPGHMNVLLAEADVAYEQLCEMDDVNANMEMDDVAIVVGANDVVNPSAIEDETSPIYGMPIINVHQAQTVFALKRGKGAGFSGLVNSLFFRENTRMIYGDAKETIAGLAAQFKD